MSPQSAQSILSMTLHPKDTLGKWRHSPKPRSKPLKSIESLHFKIERNRLSTAIWVEIWHALPESAVENVELAVVEAVVETMRVPLSPFLSVYDFLSDALASRSISSILASRFFLLSSSFLASRIGFSFLYSSLTTLNHSIWYSTPPPSLCLGWRKQQRQILYRLLLSFFPSRGCFHVSVYGIISLPKVVISNEFQYSYRILQLGGRVRVKQTNKQTIHWPAGDLERAVDRLLRPYLPALDFFPVAHLLGLLAIPLLQIPKRVSRS